MKPFSIFTISCLLILCHVTAQADPVAADPVVVDAVKQVQQDMSEAGSDENTDMVYGLAADVLGNMKDMTPEQMVKTLDDAQKNPQAFADSLTPAQKDKLKDLSSRMPATKTPGPSASSK